MSRDTYCSSLNFGLDYRRPTLNLGFVNASQILNSGLKVWNLILEHLGPNRSGILNFFFGEIYNKFSSKTTHSIWNINSLFCHKSDVELKSEVTTRVFRMSRKYVNSRHKSLTWCNCHNYCQSLSVSAAPRSSRLLLIPRKALNEFSRLNSQKTTKYFNYSFIRNFALWSSSKPRYICVESMQRDGAVNPFRYLKMPKMQLNTCLRPLST